MSDISITINGQPISVAPRTSVLEAARRLNIEIPTFCFVKGKSKAQCKICLVEVEGKDKPLRACVTMAREGMVVLTDTENVREQRKKNLEILAETHFGDCKAPCNMTCPGQVNIQGFVAHVRKGEYEEALRLVMERNPLPFSVGRVCPRFCEVGCRRSLIDEPIAVNHMERFVADWCMQHHTEANLDIKCKPSTGKKVAVVGGGPTGLSTAFYLRKAGHDVTIFESGDKLGGALRYGLPEYRIPRDVLDFEIKNILDLGISAVYGQRWGRDFSLSDLKKKGFDAISLAVGALKAKPIDIPGIDLPFVHPAIDFLKDISDGRKEFPGKRAIIIGGSNISIEAARSLVRMGVDKVTIVHSSSPDKIQAHKHSYKEAIREGINFVPMAIPMEIRERGGTLFMRTERMALGEQAQSGKSHNAPAAGLSESLKADIILYSGGQEAALEEFPAKSLERKLKLTPSGLIKVHGQGQKTDLDGVWASGDAITGPSSVIEAVVSGRRVAKYIHAEISGEEKEPAESMFNFTRGETFQDVDPVLLEGYEAQKRETMPSMEMEERLVCFDEVRKGFTLKNATREAGRCLSCGCTAFDRCKLRRYSVSHGVDLKKTGMESRHQYNIDASHPLFEMDLNKCIYCQSCKNNCEYDALELTSDGKDEQGRAVDLNFSFNDKCVNCCNCVDSCTTGALTKKDVLVPIINEPVRYVTTTCPYCGSGCQMQLKIKGNTIMEVVADKSAAPNYGMLCIKGRFAFDFIKHPDRITKPLVRKNGQLVESSWDDALSLVAKRFGELKEKHGADSLAGFSCARASNEENFLMQKFMRAVVGTNNIDHCARL